MQFTAAPKHIVQAVSVVCYREGKFLLIKRAKPAFKNWLAFPGGKIEKGETPEVAARRELMEETNLKTQELEHLITLNLKQTPTFHNNYFLSVYLSHDYTGFPIAGDDAKEIFWLTLTEMHNYRVIPSVAAVACQLIKNTG